MLFIKAIIRFLNNIRYLFRYNLKEIYRNTKETDENVYYAMNNIVFEIEEDIKTIHQYKIQNKLDSLVTLSSSNKSICRFGDGELNLLMGYDIPCQISDKKLMEKLKETITSKDENLMVAIPRITHRSRFGWNIKESIIDRATYGRLLPYMCKFLDKDIQYYSQDISFEYIQQGTNKSKEYYEYYYSLFRKIWDNRDIVIVCGDRVFSYLDYNIYDNAKTIQYIYGKTNDAFDNYDEILNEIRKCNKDKIIILMLGPTATILAMDLSKEGYRALDLGHVAKDYNAYKKGLTVSNENVAMFFAKE